MIPKEFLERMRKMPDLDHAAFEQALNEPRVRAFRINTIKTNAEKLIPLLDFSKDPIPFAKNAYYAADEKVGALPCHHAGMLYMQDPSAICTVAAAAPKCGIRAIDLCAAPGGKSTQLATVIGGDGILVSNEYVSARCRILQGNVERMGARNTVVTNLDTAALAKFYGAYFDLVVADVPCSGEGMLRKYDVAGEEWSPENVTMCAARSREILENAAALVAPNGQLLYSTCTFSLEENEQNIDAFLTAHPEFSLVPVTPEIAKITANGVNFEGATHDLALCRRFYPHLSAGEGQFVALMQRNSAEVTGKPPRDTLSAPDTKVAKLARDFLDEILLETPTARLTLLRDALWLTPEIPIPSGGVFAPGVCIGTLQKGRIEPHHQLASAYGKAYRRQIDLPHGDPRVAAYLRGEEISLTPEESKQGGGYAAVLYEGAPLGGGKIVGDRLKNHYPKGLRNRT